MPVAWCRHTATEPFFFSPTIWGSLDVKPKEAINKDDIKCKKVTSGSIPSFPTKKPACTLQHQQEWQITGSSTCWTEVKVQALVATRSAHMLEALVKPRKWIRQIHNMVRVGQSHISPMLFSANCVSKTSRLQKITLKPDLWIAMATAWNLG